MVGCAHDVEDKIIAAPVGRLANGGDLAGEVISPSVPSSEL